MSERDGTLPLDVIPPSRGCPGVYQIVCTADHRHYIGSSISITDRLRRHRTDLRRGNHHCIPLQRAWDKYGAAAFQWAILQAGGTAANARLAEQAYLDALDPDFLLNTSRRADAPPTGPQSQETIEKRAAALRGGRRTPEQRARISAARKAVGITAAHRALLNAFAARRAFRLSDQQISDCADARASDQSWERIAAMIGISPRPLRRELRKVAPALFETRAYSRPRYLGPQRPPKAPKTGRKRPDLSESNRQRVWTDEQRRRASASARRRVQRLRDLAAARDHGEGE